ncbi:MAG: hypothetical protein N2449_01755 [Bacteroidales bacterium]|nr:hypothetical protein [Bacteroidales bacterium]
MKIILIHIIILLIFSAAISQETDTLKSPNNTLTSSNNLRNNNGKIHTRFLQQVVEFQKGELIANVLVVTNISSEKLKIYIDYTIPVEWKVIAKNHKLYEIEVGDSLIVPVHIIPREKFKGNTRFMFHAFITDEKGNHLGTNYFYGLLKKNIRWALTVSENKYYLPHNTTSMPFRVGIINESTEEQDIILQASSFRKDVLIKDSLNDKEVKFPIAVTLPAFADTEFYYTFNKFQTPRNFKLIDVEDYRPGTTGEAKKYKLNFNSFSPNPSEKRKFRTGNSIDFVELSDSWEVNKYGAVTVPLILDANIFNILGQQPMMTLHLRGDMFLKDSSLLMYQTQLTYFSNYFTTIPYENAVYSLAYYHRKFYVMLGNISSGLLGTYQNGKGLRGEYYITRNHRVGAFYIASPELFRFMPKIYSFGINHYFENKIIRTNTILGRSINQNTNTTIDAAQSNISVKALKYHTFGLRIGGTRSVQNDSNYIKMGYMLGAYYSGSPIKNIWHLHLNGNYTSPNFGIFKNERIVANMSNNVVLKKVWNIQLQNNFYRYKTQVFSNLYTNYLLNNQLNVTRTNRNGLFYNPFLFYHASRSMNFDVHSRGVGFNVSNYNLEKNIRSFFNIRSGYNRAMDTLSNDYFFTQTALFVQYRTISFMLRYTLGNLNFSKQSFFNQSRKNPQSIGLSSRYQHQFKNPSFIYQQLVSYSYSTLSGNQINFTPEMMYFTRSGWRFRIFTEINFAKDSRNILPDYYYFMNNPENEIKEPTWTHNIYIGLGVRKEFGIPVPFVKPTHGTITFKAYYDINGNAKRDANETVLENVVIRVNGWEVMTNERGECVLKNIPLGVYSITAFSIVDLKGWFPNISDTLVVNKNTVVDIPFIRGVKITGKVFIQRDPNSPTADFKLDVSRIKIVASNHKVYTALTDKNGYYELYLPAGKYTLSMDESILGNRLQLLQNHFEINIDDKFDNLFMPFYIIEKSRKIKVIRFDSQGNRIDE